MLLLGGITLLATSTDSILLTSYHLRPDELPMAQHDLFAGHQRHFACHLAGAGGCRYQRGRAALLIMDSRFLP